MGGPRPHDPHSLGEALYRPPRLPQCTHKPILQNSIYPYSEPFPGADAPTPVPRPTGLRRPPPAHRRRPSVHSPRPAREVDRRQPPGYPLHHPRSRSRRVLQSSAELTSRARMHPASHHGPRCSPRLERRHGAGQSRAGAPLDGVRRGRSQTLCAGRSRLQNSQIGHSGQLRWVLRDRVRRPTSASCAAAVSAQVRRTRPNAQHARVHACSLQEAAAAPGACGRQRAAHRAGTSRARMAAVSTPLARAAASEPRQLRRARAGRLAAMRRAAGRCRAPQTCAAPIGR